VRLAFGGGPPPDRLDQQEHDPGDDGEPEQRPDPLHVAEEAPVPRPAPGEPEEQERGRAEERDVEGAADRLLEVDTAVGLLRHQRPAEAVRDEADPAQEERDHEEAPDQEGIPAQAGGHARRDATDPAPVGPVEAGAADRVEEAGAGRAGRRPRRLLRLGRGLLLEGGLLCARLGIARWRRPFACGRVCGHDSMLVDRPRARDRVLP
jgi:hypothetical protein